MLSIDSWQNPLSGFWSLGAISQLNKFEILIIDHYDIENSTNNKKVFGALSRVNILGIYEKIPSSS